MRVILAMVVLAAATACFPEASASDAAPAPPYERTCKTPQECPGRKCVELGANAQGIGGVCSARCASDDDCGAGSACFLFGDAGPSCLSLCDDHHTCSSGLVCATVGAQGERACFVTAPRPPGA